MATDRQIQANQANALKSSGPRTKAGKAASSGNALRHGLAARQIVLDGEDPIEFEVLRDDLLRDLAPISAMEEMLVDRLAQLLWRLRRIPRFEAAVLSWSQSRDLMKHNATAVTLGGVFISAEGAVGSISRTDELRAKGPDRHSRRVLGRTVQVVFAEGDVLSKLGRYERELMRQVERALAALARGRDQIAVGRLLARRVGG